MSRFPALRPRIGSGGRPAMRALLAMGLCALSLCGSVQAGEESDLERIQRTLRGQPEAAVAALKPLVATTKGPELLEVLLWIGEMQDRIPDDAGVEATAVQVERLAHDEHLPGAGAVAALLRALPMVRHGPLGRADRLLIQALELLPADAPDAVRFEFLRARGGSARVLGHLDEAVAIAQQEVLLADRLGTPWRRVNSRTDLGNTLSFAQQPEPALKAADLAAQIAREGDDPLGQADALILRALLMGDAGRDDEDLRSTRAAIELARKAGAKRRAILGLANLSDHYLRIGDNATALAVAREALPLTREVHDAGSESVALSNIGLALILLGHYEEGLASVHQSLAMEERAGAISYMADIQHELGDALEKVGRTREAWEALREYRRLSDESFRRDQQKAVLELEESFDAERRRATLVSLKTENSLQEAELLGHDLQTRVRLMAVSVGLLTLVIVAVLLRRMRRSNALLQSTNAELKVASESDPLTGLANRRHFLTRMGAADRNSEALEGALILIDLDHFKRINDHHGHGAGDAVLVEISARLRRLLREEDLAVRWGGEEFLVLVQSLPADQVEALAQRLLSGIGDEPVYTGQARIPVTASIGFASFPLSPARRPLSWERAIDLVDTAMYLAKAHGRNRAYGVRSLDEESGGDVTPAPAALERAWRGGKADLAHFAGPAPSGGVAQ